MTSPHVVRAWYVMTIIRRVAERVRWKTRMLVIQIRMFRRRRNASPTYILTSVFFAFFNPFLAKQQKMSTDARLHEKPPTIIKDTYKRYQKLGKASLDQQPDFIDLTRTSDEGYDQLLLSQTHIPPVELRNAFLDFLGPEKSVSSSQLSIESPKVFQIVCIPGKRSRFFLLKLV